MGKKLSKMSLEELWQLFPIILTEHQECWKEWYLEEETLLKKVLPDSHHQGRKPLLEHPIFLDN